MQPLVSLIIPVYKVEPYLARCVRSVCRQTYENLEIILVDDGSPDRCGMICDALAREDVRISVFHQSNNGLSSARNTGIDLSSGQYVLFVDSDDWIERDMVTSLVVAISCCDADVCCCGCYDHYRKIAMFCKSHKEQIIYKNDSILTALIDGQISNTAWGKLWKRSIFESGIRFPIGRNYEDVATTWKLLSSCKVAVCIPQALYQYAPRPTGITQTRDLSNIRDYWSAYRERFHILGQNENWYNRTLLECLFAVGYVWRWYYSASKAAGQSDEELLEDVNAFVLEHLDFVKRRECHFNIKATSIFACHNNKLSLLACHFYNQIYELLNEARRKRNVIFQSEGAIKTDEI